MNRSIYSANWHYNFCCILIIFAFIPTLMADWPTFRHDNQRSARTKSSIHLPLNLAWKHIPAAPPTRAWGKPKHRNFAAGAFNLSSTLDFDSAFHPIIANGKVYYASSSTDSIYCLSSNAVGIWQFSAEAPIRLSPVYAEQKIYFGSDDGHI